MDISARRVNFDLDALRSFVVGIDLGGFAKAADRLGRSSSAVSAHLKKLEEQIGAPILRKAGRGLVLTPTGELLLSYARRLLALNDEAALALRGTELSGSVRIGVQEDFGETLLPDMLGAFSRAHPRVSLEAHVVRNAALLKMMESSQLDLALAWDTGAPLPHGESLGQLPLCWIAPAATTIPPAANLPLVLFEAPCVMRSLALQALDGARLPWRIALASTSLSGIWAAVGAGLGVTVRTRVGLPPRLRVRSDLPALPSIGLMLYRATNTPSATVESLAEIVRATARSQLDPTA